MTPHAAIPNYESWHFGNMLDMHITVQQLGRRSWLASVHRGISSCRCYARTESAAVRRARRVLRHQMAWFGYQRERRVPPDASEGAAN